MNQKRNRSLNWDEEEKQLFRLVLKEYAHILENKSMDTNTSKLKVKAWNEVLKKFNELNCRPRELGQLKVQWKTMKIYARKAIGSFNKEIKKTGGGPRPESPSQELDEIKDLLNPAELLRDSNPFDSDGAFMTDVNPEIEFPDQGFYLSPLPQGISSTTYDIESIVHKVPSTSSDNDNKAILVIVDKENEAIKDSENIEPHSSKKPLKQNLLKKSSSKSSEVVDKETEATDGKENIGTNSSKKQLKQRLFKENSSKSSKENDNYIAAMIAHSKMLKDKEHKRRVEMIEEEHAIKMATYKEKFEAAVFEKTIMKIRCRRENNLGDYSSNVSD